MDIFSPKSNRRSSRLRVEISLTVTSLDRMRPFAEKCVALVISAHGCGFRSPSVLPVGTPVMLSDLPSGGTVTARVANCLPLGKNGKHFLIGASLYTYGNIWGIANAPKDWEAPGCVPDSPGGAWPYNRVPAGVAPPTTRK